MEDDVKPLLEFLERFGADVTGHGEAPPQSEMAAKLERFALGECDDRERVEVCEMLRLHPAWLRWLADRVRMARDRPVVELTGTTSSGNGSK